MTFDGRFSESLLAEQLERVSLSFLVNDMQIRRGGVAANITFGLGCLGLTPVLLGSVGEDFTPYQRWLEEHGVDCSWVHYSATEHTARFICTTDQNQAQIASFYTGAMAEADRIDLRPIHEQTPLDLVLVGPNDPTAMLLHTQQCRELGIPFAADPSQQLAWSDGERIREFVAGAHILFSNDYEAGLIRQKTGWSEEEVRAQVDIRVTTHGEGGVLIEARDREPIRVAAVPPTRLVEPTGVGDAFRAGFLAGLAWDLPLTNCAQVGCVLATLVLETTGTQEYQLTPAAFLERLADAYGADAAAVVAGHLSVLTS